MMSLQPTQCCGMMEINNLSHCDTAEDALYAVHIAVQPQREASRPAFLMFSGVTQRVRQDHASGRGDDYGQAFADAIIANRLGEVSASVERRNSRTGNTIRVWVWAPDHQALAAWATPKVVERNRLAEEQVRKARARINERARDEWDVYHRSLDYLNNSNNSGSALHILRGSASLMGGGYLYAHPEPPLPVEPMPSASTDSDEVPF